MSSGRGRGWIISTMGGANESFQRGGEVIFAV